MNETTTYVSVEEVVKYAVGRTLADEDVKFDQAAIIDIVCGRIAHGYDIHATDIEVVAVDVMIQPDKYSWGVDLIWWVPCHECELPAELGAYKFTPLCRTHWLEAVAQEKADLENDDIKADIYDE